MNGQLSEHPFGELIREISSKKLSGRLRLQHDRVVIVTYFEDGAFQYAAANVRPLRLGEYLLNKNLVTAEQLQRIGDRKSDLQLAAAVTNENLADVDTVKSLQLKQQVDTLRMALLWTEGTWDFDHRSHLNERVNLKLNVQDLFLEAGRRLPLQFSASRFRNEQEIFSLNENATNANRLEPREGFMLSRLDRPTPLKELLALSGLREEDALRIIYSLALAGYLTRQHWKSAFRDEVPSRQPPQTETVADEVPRAVVESPEINTEDFLARGETATTHYEVLAVSDDASATDIKTAYYDIARRYHPDRFRRDHDSSLHTRVEALFARITQAYETLADTGRRAAYDSKLAARQNISHPPPPKEMPVPKIIPVQLVSTPLPDQVEVQFQEGMAALQRGHMNQAAALFASVAKVAPNDARFRAFHGRALAANEKTRRNAESELRTALKLDPDNPDYRTMLAELYRDLGFAKRARAEAERALATAPNHQGARKLLQTLPQ